jgi:hypothetical protein
MQPDHRPNYRRRGVPVEFVCQPNRKRPAQADDFERRRFDDVEGTAVAGLRNADEVLITQKVRQVS